MFKHLGQLASESLIYGLSMVILRFLNILLVPILTRIFAPEDYGVISLVTTTMSMIGIFAVLGLDNSANRWFWDTEDIAERKRTIGSWIWCQLVISMFLALLVIASADGLGTLIVQRGDAGAYFRLAALTLPLNTIGSATVLWLRMQRRPRMTIVLSIGFGLLNTLLTILFVAVLHQGVTGMYLAQLVYAVNHVWVAAVLMRDWLSPAHFSFERLRVMLRYALPLIPGTLAFWVVSFSDRFFVQFYTTMGEVGLYQVGSSIAALVALATGAFQQAWVPFAMSIHKRDDAGQIYANVLLAYLWFTSFISTTLALLAPEAIRLVATQRYLGASPVVGILAFSYVMIGLGTVATVGPFIVKRTSPAGIAMIVAAGFNIVLNLLLVPSMGKVGSAFATLVSQSVVPVYLFYRSQQLYPIPYHFKTALGILILSTVLIVLGAMIPFDNLWVGILAKLVLIAMFIPALFLLRIVTIAQARSLVQRVTASSRLAGQEFLR